MNSIKKILFPVDFSAQCEAMGQYVLRVAELYSAEVTLLHIVDPTELDILEELSLYVQPLGELREEHFALREERLLNFLASTMPAESFRRVAVSGDPSSEIVKFAEAGAYDLIVMCPHRSRVKQAFLGSTTSAVVDAVDCPDMLSSHAEATMARSLEHRVWLYLLPTLIDRRAEVELACGLSQEIAAHINFLYVRREPEVLRDARPFDLEEDDAARRELYSLLAGRSNVRRADILKGDAVTEAIRLAHAYEADLIITSRAKPEDGIGRLSAPIYQLVRHSNCPVLLL